jgi:hypothetical protein
VGAKQCDMTRSLSVSKMSLLRLLALRIKSNECQT